MEEELRQLKEQLLELLAERDLRIKEAGGETETADLVKDLEDQILELEEYTKVLKEDIRKTAKELEKKDKKLQQDEDERVKAFENTKLLSAEEMDDIRSSSLTKKLNDYEEYCSVSRKYDEQNKVLDGIKRKIRKLKNDINIAEALELTPDEYKEVTSTMIGRITMQHILEKKGLTYILEKKPEERTKEEKELLKQTKMDIRIEIYKFMQEHDDYSVLDSIEALYTLKQPYRQIKPSKEYLTTEESLEQMKKIEEACPKKIVNPNSNTTTVVKEEAPKDMENATSNDKPNIRDLKPAEEKVTLFKNEADGEYYVRKYAADRFKLKSVDKSKPEMISGSTCYKISESDVKNIKENARNSFSPYIVVIKDFTFDKKEEKAETKPNIEEIKSIIDEAFSRVPETQTTPIAIQVPETPTTEATNSNLEEIFNVVKAQPQPEPTEYTPKNIQATDEFKKELKKNNIFYRIVHAIPNLAKRIIKKLRKSEKDEMLSDSIQDNSEIERGRQR